MGNTDAPYPSHPSHSPRDYDAIHYDASLQYRSDWKPKGPRDVRSGPFFYGGNGLRYGDASGYLVSTSFLQELHPGLEELPDRWNQTKLPIPSIPYREDDGTKEASQDRGENSLVSLRLNDGNGLKQ